MIILHMRGHRLRYCWGSSRSPSGLRLVHHRLLRAWSVRGPVVLNSMATHGHWMLPQYRGLGVHNWRYIRNGIIPAPIIINL